MMKLFGAKPQEWPKICPTVVAFTYLLSRNTLFHLHAIWLIFEKYPLQKICKTGRLLCKDKSSQKFYKCSPWRNLQRSSYHLVNLCDKRVSFCQGCIGPVKNNGLPFPPLYDIAVVTKMCREYFNDGKKAGVWTIRYILSCIFTRISSHFHLNVFNVVWWYSQWIASSCIPMLLKACPMLIKFICNVWVCQYHCFTWSYQPMTYVCINILALTHIQPGSNFGSLTNFENCMVFWRLQAVKNQTLGEYELRTYQMLLCHCEQMCYFLPPENFRKCYSFLKFSVGKKWNKQRPPSPPRKFLGSQEHLDWLNVGLNALNAAKIRNVQDYIRIKN